MLAPNAKLRSMIIPGGPADEHGDALHPSASTRISWARLLKRVLDIDIEQCRRHLEDHHRHRKSACDRQDPRAPRLVRPGTANYRRGTSLSSKPPERQPISHAIRFSSLSRPPPVAPHPPLRHLALWARMNGTTIPRFGTEIPAILFSVTK